VNIFILDENPLAAARMHCDKHVPKMVVESAQMLSTAHRMLDGKEYLAPSKSGKRMTKHYLLERNDDVIYKAVHAAHPCTVWTMQSASNYIWHYGLFHALSEEFEYRFKKIHRSWDILKDILSVIPKNITDIGPTPYAKAMKAYPDIAVIENPVEAYRQFYIADKIEFAKWEKGRSAPTWWNTK
jgi:hypothetical protein